jgi:hypothetical protein
LDQLGLVDEAVVYMAYFIQNGDGGDWEPVDVIEPVYEDEKEEHKS